MKKCLVKYKDAEKIIEEGDVLLFRGKTAASWIIKSVGDGPYSHCGLASWVFSERGERSRLECVEFKEWKGGRAIALENTVKDYDGLIDVFTPNRYHLTTAFDCISKTKHLNKTFFRGRLITNELRGLTGLPYSWNRIWWIICRRINLLWRDYNNYEDIPEKDLIYPVCSTAIAYCYSKHFADLTHFKADQWMEPSDLSRSPILNYIFTLTT